MIKAQDILDLVSQHLDWFRAEGEPQRLEGGNLNYVWRIEGQPKSVIVKYFAPHIAAASEVPLDVSRMLVESRCLQSFEAGGEFEAIASRKIRPPHVYYVSVQQKVLVMEDVGSSNTSLQALQSGWFQYSGQETGQLIGSFIGSLHAQSFANPHLAEQFNNSQIQKTRLELQYKAVGKLLEQAGISDAQTLGQKVRSLGEQYLQPGKSVVMGDLWPPSIIPTAQGLRVIDWELAHYGYPAQDLGHFSAHLWMIAHRSEAAVAQEAQSLWQSFFNSYREALGAKRDELLGDCSIHFGAEILVRTVGRFQSGYLYEGLEERSPIIQEAVETAAHHIRSPEEVNTFAPLRQ